MPLSQASQSHGGTYRLWSLRIVLALVVACVPLVVSVSRASASWGIRTGAAFTYYNQYGDCWYNQSGIDGHGPSGYFYPMGEAQTEGSSGGGGCSHTFYPISNPPYWMGIEEWIWYGGTLCFNGTYVDNYGYSYSTPFDEIGYWEIGWCGGYGWYDNETKGWWDPTNSWYLKTAYGTATHSKNIQP